jgi:hypothetical protein
VPGQDEGPELADLPVPAGSRRGRWLPVRHRRLAMPVITTLRQG